MAMQDFSKFKPDNSAFYVRHKTRIIEAITHASIMAMVFLAGEAHQPCSDCPATVRRYKPRPAPTPAGPADKP